MSLNVRRRHLTSAQKRAVIAAYIEAEPAASDRTVGRHLGVDHKTAAQVRADLAGRSNDGVTLEETWSKPVRA
jgi:hypothetical protein